MKNQFAPEEEGLGVSDAAQREAVLEMLDFVERNHVRLRDVSVKELIHDDKAQP